MRLAHDYFFQFEKSYDRYNDSSMDAVDLFSERRIPVVTLLRSRSILKRLSSFSEPVARCNFETRSGYIIIGAGKTYIDKHGVKEYKPADLRGVVVLDLYYVKAEDSVVLTEEQYADFKNELIRAQL